MTETLDTGKVGDDVVLGLIGETGRRWGLRWGCASITTVGGPGVFEYCVLVAMADT